MSDMHKPSMAVHTCKPVTHGQRSGKWPSLGGQGKGDRSKLGENGSLLKTYLLIYKVEL